MVTFVFLKMLWCSLEYDWLRNIVWQNCNKYTLEFNDNKEEKIKPNANKRDDVDEEGYDFSSDWVPRSSFDTDQLVAVVRDLFIAGVETTSSTLLWLLMFMCKHPEVQQKMQNEIDYVLGPSGVPRMALMERLPYVRAVIQVCRPLFCLIRNIVSAFLPSTVNGHQERILYNKKYFC